MSFVYYYHAQEGQLALEGLNELIMKKRELSKEQYY